MPRYIEQLNECTDPASGDWLWVVDSSAASTDKDRRVNVGKFSRLADLGTFDQGLAIGVAGNRLYRPTPGVLRQKLEWTTVNAGSALLVAADSSGRALVHVYSATFGLMAMFAVEGPSSSRMIHGDSTYFSPTVMAGKIVCYCETTNSIYVYNGTGSQQVLAVMAWT